MPLTLPPSAACLGLSRDGDPSNGAPLVVHHRCVAAESCPLSHYCPQPMVAARDSNCCCFCRLLPRPVSQMVWKLVGTTCVALIVLVTLQPFLNPPVPFPLSSIATLCEKILGSNCSAFHTCGGRCLFCFIKSCVLTTDSSLNNLETEKGMGITGLWASVCRG